MTVICLIIIKQNPTKGYINGRATYRSTSKTYKDFDFKLYNNQNNKDIHDFEEGDVIYTGKFFYRHNYNCENPLIVCIL